MAINKEIKRTEQTEKITSKVAQGLLFIFYVPSILAPDLVQYMHYGLIINNKCRRVKIITSTCGTALTLVNVFGKSNGSKFNDWGVFITY